MSRRSLSDAAALSHDHLTSCLAKARGPSISPLPHCSARRLTIGVDQVRALKASTGPVAVDRPCVRRSRQLRQKVRGLSAAPRAAALRSASSSDTSTFAGLRPGMPGLCRALVLRVGQPAVVKEMDRLSEGRRSSGAGGAAVRISIGRTFSSRGQRGLAHRLGSQRMSRILVRPPR